MDRHNNMSSSMAPNRSLQRFRTERSIHVYTRYLVPGMFYECMYDQKPPLPLTVTFFSAQSTLHPNADGGRIASHITTCLASGVPRIKLIHPPQLHLRAHRRLLVGVTQPAATAQLLRDTHTAQVTTKPVHRSAGGIALHAAETPKGRLVAASASTQLDSHQASGPECFSAASFREERRSPPSTGLPWMKSV